MNLLRTPAQWRAVWRRGETRKDFLLSTNRLAYKCRPDTGILDLGRRHRQIWQ